MGLDGTAADATAIEPMPPNKPRGVPRAHDRHIHSGIFWVPRYRAACRTGTAALFSDGDALRRQRSMTSAI